MMVVVGHREEYPELSTYKKILFKKCLEVSLESFGGMHLDLGVSGQ